MNLSLQLSTDLAVATSLFAAFLWGSWFISLKHLGEYPLDAYVMTLFTTSLVFVYAAGWSLEGPALLANVLEILDGDPGRVAGTLVGGVVYAAGMRLVIVVLSRLGLALAQPIHSSMVILAVDGADRGGQAR